ncbi:MAG: four helix bundle protein [Patescibacteria group bacterium]|nr:four helix bundle protein [Patescibacteria group bacterium]
MIENTNKKFLQLNDINTYKIALPLSNYVWNIVIKWDYLAKDTVGKQFIRAIDSISANIAEGFGRKTKKDKIKFYNYSYGSIYESLDWNEKAKIRGLLSEEQYLFIFSQLKQLPREVNSLIKFTNKKMLS